jgi:hypothetical protein
MDYSEILKASEVTLQVLRQKTGNCGSFRPGWDDATVVLPRAEGAGAASGTGRRGGFGPTARANGDV